MLRSDSRMKYEKCRQLSRSVHTFEGITGYRIVRCNVPLHQGVGILLPVCPCGFSIDDDE
jgi:hypothetical protein